MKKNFTREQVREVSTELQKWQEQHAEELKKSFETSIYEGELEMMALNINCAFRFLLGQSCQEFVDEYNATIAILKQLQIMVLMPNGPDNQKNE